MIESEREAILERLREYVAQLHEADDLADRNSLERGADIAALYEDKHWMTEVDPPKVRHSRGRPVDPESFSRFTKWLDNNVNLSGRHAYRLRDAHEMSAIYLTQGQIKPAGERAIRPLKWLTKHGHADAVRTVWKKAVELAGGTPDSPTVRKALAQWKRENLPKAERTTGEARTAARRVAAWKAEARRLMELYPEMFIGAVNDIEAEAETYFGAGEAAA